MIIHKISDKITNLVYLKDSKQISFDKHAWDVKNTNQFMLGRNIGLTTFFYNEGNFKSLINGFVINIPTMATFNTRKSYMDTLPQKTFSSNKIALALFEKPFNKDYMPVFSDKDSDEFFKNSIHKNTVLVPQIIQYNDDGIIEDTFNFNDGYKIEDQDQPLIIYDLKCIGTNGKSTRRFSYDKVTNSYPGPFIISIGHKVNVANSGYQPIDVYHTKFHEIYTSSSYPWRKAIIERYLYAGTGDFWKPDYEGQADIFIVLEGFIIDQLQTNTGTRILKSQLFDEIVKFDSGVSKGSEDQELDSQYVKI